MEMPMVEEAGGTHRRSPVGSVPTGTVEGRAPARHGGRIYTPILQEERVSQTGGAPLILTQRAQPPTLLSQAVATVTRSEPHYIYPALLALVFSSVQWE